MNRTEFNSRYDKNNSPNLFKGYSPNPPDKKEPAKMVFRPSGYDFVVDWQMNDKPFKNKEQK